ncbi:hypothetical protein [Calidifontibacter terrae]
MSELSMPELSVSELSVPGDLCLGPAWVDRSPVLRFEGRAPLDLIDRRLAFEAGPQRECTGASVADENGALTHRGCPRGRPATRGRQCAECAADDQFRFAHHAHRGGYVPPALASYLEAPHLVYIATFADGVSKVGTAVHHRKVGRLDEQGPLVATYVVDARDGRQARLLEDLVSERLGLTQFKHRSSKVAALLADVPQAEVTKHHEWTVSEALDALATEPDADLIRESWNPPAAQQNLLESLTRHPVSAYPHSLVEGDHCLTVRAMAGATAVVNVNDDDTPFLADLGALAGHRLRPADVRSAPVPTQLGLF